MKKKLLLMLTMTGALLMPSATSNPLPSSPIPMPTPPDDCDYCHGYCDSGCGGIGTANKWAVCSDFPLLPDYCLCCCGSDNCGEAPPWCYEC